MKKIVLSFLIFSFVLTFFSCKDKNDISTNNTGQIDTAFVKTITFYSLDSLEITADHYHINNSSPVIILCHQAGWSRGEYIEIATRLNDLGYNALAIDQRSGMAVNGIENETAKNASIEQKSMRFIDAKQDIQAAIDWAKNRYNQKVILWGSSYSSSLSLMISAERDDVSKVLAFSPGEYLQGISVQGNISGISIPCFLTSSKSERVQTEKLYNAITNTSYKKQFIPMGDGQHGSRNLWSSMPDHEEYWAAVEVFLNY